MPALTIDIEARYAKFQDAMTAMERSAKKSAGNITSAFQSVSGALAGLGVGISVAGLVAIVRNAVDAADHLNDLSKQTGVAVDVLGGLGFAAAQAGGNLESIAGAAGKLNKSIAEAAAGNKEFSVAFEKLGIDIHEANGALKTADKVMVELANKFEGFADGPEKVAIAMRLLGKTGAEQIALLNDGGRALQANIELYRRYAGVTQETANKADAFNDNLEKLHLISGAFGRQLAAELLPALEGVSTELLRAKENGEGFKTWAERGAGAIKFLGLAVVDTGKTFESFGIRLGGIVAQSKALAELNFSKFLEESGKVRQRLDELNDSYGRMQGAIRNGKASNPFDQVFNIVEGNIGQDKKLMESRVQLLQKYNNEGLLSDKDFYAGREAAQREYIAETKKNLGAEIGILKEKAKRTKDAKELEEINTKIGDLVLKRESVGAEKPRAPVLPNPANDGGQKTLEGQLKQLERMSDRERDIYASRKDMLSTFYQQDLIAIDDYYAARQAAADEALNAQSKNIDEEIALLQKRSPKDENERASNEAKIRELQDKKSKLEADAATEATRNFVDQAIAAKAFQRELDGINVRLLEQQGLFSQAAGQNFDQQTEQIRTKLQTELEKANSSGNTGRALQLEGFQKKLDMLRQIAVAQGRLNELQEVESRIQSDLQIVTDRTDAAAATGSITQLEALRQVSDARQQAAVDMKAVADAFAQTAAESGDQKFIQQAKAMQAQAEKLGATADLVREKFQGVFENGFDSFFDKLTSGTASIKDAFKSLFADIAADLSKLAIRDLGSQLFSKDGAFGGIVDFTAGLFGKPANPTSASAGVASALASTAGSASDAAAAASMTALAASATAADAGLLAMSATVPALDASLLAMSASIIAADTAVATMAAAATAASAALATVGASSAAGAAGGFFDILAAAKGHVFNSGSAIPFAKGGTPDVVSSPMLFPMKGGKTGLMGEAGPEAIVPLHRDKGGQLAIKMVGDRGDMGLLPIARDRSGKLSVRAPGGITEKFANGSAFDGGFTTNTAGLFSSRSATGIGAVVPGLIAQAEPVSGGDIYNVNVSVPPGTPQESANQIGARTAMAITRSSRRNN